MAPAAMPHLMDAPKADRVEVERAIALIFTPGDIVEVRIPKTRVGVVAGYFDDHAALANSIFAADGQYQAAGVYYALNRRAPALLGRAYTRLKERAEYTTADSNILK